MVRTLALSLLVAAAAGCQDPPAKTPEDCYMLLHKACDKGDPARIFDQLDTATQWSIESVHRDQREMRRLILESYPATEQAAALARIPSAVEELEEHPRRYFRRLPRSPEILTDLGRRLKIGFGNVVGSLDFARGTATVWRDGGSVFNFAKDEKGRWGLSELRDEWEHAKLRATHDLQTVRDNARLYGGLQPRG